MQNHNSLVSPRFGFAVPGCRISWSLLLSPTSCFPTGFSMEAEREKTGWTWGLWGKSDSFGIHHSRVRHEAGQKEGSFSTLHVTMGTGADAPPPLRHCFSPTKRIRLDATRDVRVSKCDRQGERSWPTRSGPQQRDALSTHRTGQRILSNLKRIGISTTHITNAKDAIWRRGVHTLDTDTFIHRSERLTQ